MFIHFRRPDTAIAGLVILSSLAYASSSFARAEETSAPTRRVHNAHARNVLPVRFPKGNDEAVYAYALVRQDRQGMRVHAHEEDLGGLQALKTRFGNDFFWFRLGRQAYVIQDPATMGRIQDLFKPGEDLDRQEQELDRQEEKLDRRQEDLEAQLERLEERLEGLEEEAEAQEDAAAHPRLEAQRQPLDKERAGLNKEFQALSREMEKLAKRQEALGSTQETAELEAERALQGLMTEAIRSSIAKPVSGDGFLVKR